MPSRCRAVRLRRGRASQQPIGHAAGGSAASGEDFAHDGLGLAEAFMPIKVERTLVAGRYIQMDDGLTDALGPPARSVEQQLGESATAPGALRRAPRPQPSQRNATCRIAAPTIAVAVVFPDRIERAKRRPARRRVRGGRRVCRVEWPTLPSRSACASPETRTYLPARRRRARSSSSRSRHRRRPWAGRGLSGRRTRACRA